MADIVEIKHKLNDRIIAVVEYLLPNGRKDGNEWRAGSTGGEKGKSLGVHLVGSKAGVWSDFSSSEGGDLVDLWMATRRMSLAPALEDISSWLGLSKPEPFRDPRPNYSRPEKPKCGKPANKAKAYLNARGIPDGILDVYRVGEHGDSIIFPFLLPDGTLALAKSRKAEDGAKPVPTAANCEPVLFGWQAIAPNAREIIITEGEIDALSWATYGHNATSVPFGGGKGGKQNWIENDFDRLQRFEKIYISTDMDPVGDEAAEEIASRLGRHRCLRVKLPRKDANKCLTEKITNEEMDACLRDAQGLDPDGLKRPSDFIDRVTYLFWPAEGDRIGYTMPMEGLRDKIHFRPAELTLWSGASGHGKSQILSDCIPTWIKQGSRVCIASLEMKGEQTLKRMSKQVGGVDRPTVGYLRRILTWLDEGLLLYERVGKAGVAPLLEVFDYAHAKYGCDQFIIDSLMRLGIAQDDYNGQEKAVFQIVDWAISKNVHMHLVAHSRKGGKDQGAPDTEDVKGAMEIGANAFNIITVWRNKLHEEKMKAAKTDEERLQLDEKPGVLVNIAKQRNGDYEGKKGLWFDQKTYRYHGTSNRNYWDRQLLDRVDRSLDEDQDGQNN
ncbi:toprim domain-containing protein [Rhizobium tubonense]|uniref:DNA primase n=1 Tax=Rhizobium tubonense TaxID=484088 RepID=A0A2W4C875_9HYPH|nr:toprim domain-containing protein [Rhizobium tubonense]PZM07598.1 DNA primase [Rhizobium tubonense]